MGKRRRSLFQEVKRLMIHIALWIASAWFLASIGGSILFALKQKWDRELKRRNYYARVRAEEDARVRAEVAARVRAEVAAQRRRAQRVGNDLLDTLEMIDAGYINDHRRWI